MAQGGMNIYSGTVPTGNPTGAAVSPTPQIPMPGGNGGSVIPTGGTGGAHAATAKSGDAFSLTAGGSSPLTPAPTGVPTRNPSTAINPANLSSANLNPANMLGSLNNDKFRQQLDNIFGKGTGNALLSMLVSGGGFNPQVAQALIQAMQPQVDRNWGNIATQLGNAGLSPSSSAYGVAAGDYFSQVSSQENALLANEYNMGVNNEMSLFSSILPTVHSEEANKGGIFGTLSNILGGVGAAAPFLSMIPGVGPMLGGIAGVAGAVGKGMNGNSSVPTDASTNPVANGHTPPFIGNSLPGDVGNSVNDIIPNVGGSSASGNGAAAPAGNITGGSGMNNNSDNPDFNNFSDAEWQQFFMGDI